MANHLMSLFFAFNLLLIISAHGRVFQKNNDTSSAAYFSGRKGKIVSLQSTGFTGQTNSDDVEGLVALVTSFPLLEESNPDPCLTPKWTWIECNSDAKPRIIALDLSGKILYGSLPDFSSMDALQIIDLSQNSLLGAVPSFLGTFPDLQELNLANNYFDGFIPDSLAWNKKLKLSVASNAGLYVSSKCTGTGNIVDATLTPTTTFTPTTYTYRKKSNVGVIAGSLSGVFLLISIGVGIFAIFRHKAKTAAAIAAANAGTLPSDQKTNMPTEEMPMNSRPTNMSPP